MGDRSKAPQADEDAAKISLSELNGWISRAEFRAFHLNSAGLGPISRPRPCRARIFLQEDAPEAVGEATARFVAKVLAGQIAKAA